MKLNRNLKISLINSKFLQNYFKNYSIIQETDALEWNEHCKKYFYVYCFRFGAAVEKKFIKYQVLLTVAFPTFTISIFFTNFCICVVKLTHICVEMGKLSENLSILKYVNKKQSSKILKSRNKKKTKQFNTWIISKIWT